VSPSAISGTMAEWVLRMGMEWVLGTPPYAYDNPCHSMEHITGGNNYAELSAGTLPAFFWPPFNKPNFYRIGKQKIIKR